ncbi:response regulator transcription factor [Halobacteriovorax sp. GB3]|uniref:response regulator transcription factor n=1 Tax=Halobacteriovorax sp. GB3 TaxID=2719615 RepID=UPI00235F2F2C|nr:response regulator transcription factor [Halobacteriovorax sp. GB3]MDD0852106.1 response regulator transcription factor [Halobacteriovorax sp. GB3]
MSHKILVIEDDENIQLGLKKALEAESFIVEQAFDGEDGVYLAGTVAPDLIILDIMMPFMNGFEVISELRGEGNEIPIIVLSARVETQDKVRGLKLGADDYMEKPFALEELLARVHRKLGSSIKEEVVFGEFNYSLKTSILRKSDSAIELSGKEIKLIEFLLKRDGQVVNREQIISAVWGSSYDGTDRTVDNFILGLRKKIEKEHLVTVRGLGYRFMTKP